MVFLTITHMTCLRLHPFVCCDKKLFISPQVGGVEEYKVIEAMKAGKITKPLVAWCIGTCAQMFTSEVF